MFNPSNDLKTIFKEFGTVASTKTGATVRGLLENTPSYSPFAGNGQGMEMEEVETTFTYPSVNRVGIGERITVEGTEYEVQRVTRLDDGLLSKATLSLPKKTK